jgi:DNA topoisomerase VI subunit A
MASTAASAVDDEAGSLADDNCKTVYYHMGSVVPDPTSDTSSSEVSLEDFFLANGDEDEDDDDPEVLFHQADGTDRSNLENDTKRFYLNLQAPKVFNNIHVIMEESKKFGKRNYRYSFGFAPTTTSYFSNESEGLNIDGGNERHYYEDTRDYLTDMAIMKEIQVMLMESFGRNNRGFFYVMRGRMAKNLGRDKLTKENWDMRINRICSITGYPRNLLNIIVEARANVMGPIKFVREQEEFIVTAFIDGIQQKIKVIRLREEINMANGVHLLGHLFVNDSLGVDSNNVHFRARISRGAIPRYVLFVESEETARIIRSSMFFTRSDTPGVVVCGKGRPSFYARHFIRMMTEAPLSVKVFACTDINPHGLKIIEGLTSTVGGRSTNGLGLANGRFVNAPESELCKVENVWWAGPFPSDVVPKLSQNSESYDEQFVEQLQHWKSTGPNNDEDTLQSLLIEGNGSFVNQGSSNERRIELKLMHERHINVEGEAFEDDIVHLLRSRIRAAIREEEGWNGGQVK